MPHYRVILADDCRDIIELVSRSLPAELEVIAEARDGPGLIRCAEQLHPDLIITDICMPVLSGLEAARKLVKNKCGAQFVFLTAHADPELLSACLALGTTSYVIKSRVATDLIPATQAALAGCSFISPGMSAPFSPGLARRGDSRDGVPGVGDS